MLTNRDMFGYHAGDYYVPGQPGGGGGTSL